MYANAYTTYWKFVDDTFDITTQQCWLAVVNQHDLVA